MGQYLYHYFISNYKVRDELNEMASKRGLELSPHKESYNIDSSIIVRDLHYGCLSFLSEFPGNCSALVLHSIQEYFYIERNRKVIDNVIKFSLEVCKSLEYYLLFVTCTSEGMKNYLMKNYEFEIAFDPFINFHSGSINYFLIKRVDKEKIQPVVVNI